MYRFLTGNLPAAYHPNYDTHLFNELDHRLLQNPIGWQSFYMVDDDRKEAVGAIHVFVAQQKASSPFRSPYGGYDLNPSVPFSVLVDFIGFVDSELKTQGVQSLELKLASRPLNDAMSIEKALANNDYELARIEKAAMLSVSEEFVDHLHFSEQKRLRKLNESNFQVEHLPVARWSAVYEFIHRCRSAKGFPVSMHHDEVGQLVEKFPERIFLFRVTHNSTWAAASFCVQTKTDIVYDFYHDHDASFDTYSPVVLLVKFMNDFFLNRAVKWIDLGTSMLGDEVNEGLDTFKKRLGSKEFVKLTFQKNFS